MEQESCRCNAAVGARVGKELLTHGMLRCMIVEAEALHEDIAVHDFSTVERLHEHERRRCTASARENQSQAEVLDIIK